MRKILNRINRNFLNLVFRKRLGKKRWSAKLIFFIFNFLGKFETYTNGGDVGNSDHYVPQLLLRHWRMAESGSDMGQIICWSKTHNKIEKKGIKSEVAGEVDWDVVTAQGIPSDYINKKIFGELLESYVGRVLELINNDSSITLTFLEESTLAVFVAHQITRVPAFRTSLSRFFSIGYSTGLIVRSDFGDRNILLKKVALNQIGVTYEQFINTTPSMKIDGGKPQIILLSLVIASDVAEQIHRGNLHILEVPENSTDEFVLSDNPVVFIDFKRVDTLRFIPWWEIGKKDFMILMPISRKKAIFYCNSKRKDGCVEKDNDELVRLLNFGQYLCSTEQVFSQNKEIIEKHLNLFDSELKKEKLL